MKINRIKIYNISSFAGVQELDFSVSDGKSIVLIGGQNGTGKSSLFAAIKLALYGPLSFNYQSANNFYLARVKEFINHDAFTSSEVRAYIEIDLDIPNERESNQYLLRRSWKYNDQKLSEELLISKDGVRLEDDELTFFENYLFTVLPPNLFDFIFFDGEQIADFFASSNYNMYVKNAFLTLCSLDTFELIKKFCNNYINANENTEEVKEIALRYREITDEIEETNRKIVNSDQNILDINTNLYDVINEKEELENLFKRSGGLSQKEIEKLNKKLKELERVREECNLKIKGFVENTMPFIIAKNIVPALSKQLELEDEMQKYQALMHKLRSEQVVKAIVTEFNISDSETDEFVIKLISAIATSAMPNIDGEKFVFLHDLSKEQHGKVISVINQINEFNPNELLKDIEIKEKVTNEHFLANKKLRESMAEMDAYEYSQKFSNLIEIEFKNKTALERLALDLESQKLKLESLINEKSQIFEQLKSKTKDKSIYELTQKIGILMDRIIHDLSDSKIRQIEEQMLSILRRIMRKDNFIDLIEIDTNFNISLYKKQTYGYRELANLIKNIGQDDLAKRIGKSGVNKVKQFFEIDSFTKLKNYLRKTGDQIGLFNEQSIDLFKKISFNQLSKGEKQIFILSLYWAIIKISMKTIPFIIDTPYARIDTEHREQISKEFFPMISDQVIIFSTDEEITEHYYLVLKPFIAKEYLLEYNEIHSKTMVSNKYFFKGDRNDL